MISSSPVSSQESLHSVKSRAVKQSAFGQEWQVIYTLWKRDMLRLKLEKSRWFGVVLQPLLFWAIIGSGMQSSFQGESGAGYSQFFYPGILAMIILFTTIFSTISLIEDRQMGFLQAVLIAPSSRFAVILGKIAGVVTIVLLQSCLFLLLSPLASYPFSAISWPMLFAVIVLGTVGLTAINIAMAWILSTAQSYHAVMSVVLLPLWVVSGAMFPVNQQSWIGMVMKVNPMTYLVEGLRMSLSSQHVGGFSAATVFSVLILCTAVALLIANKVAKRDGVKE